MVLVFFILLFSGWWLHTDIHGTSAILLPLHLLFAHNQYKVWGFFSKSAYKTYFQVQNMCLNILHRILNVLILTGNIKAEEIHLKYSLQHDGKATRQSRNMFRQRSSSNRWFGSSSTEAELRLHGAIQTVSPQKN